jgi:ribosomal protein S25
MRLSLVGVRGNKERASEPLAVHVDEPPATGRPPGFASGDVGTFALAAEIAPREVRRGEAVSVSIELSGTGNLPSSLPITPRPGVDWLEPEIKEKLGKQPGDKYGGTRRFAYVVKLDREGDVDLGEIALPHFDPEANAYATARVTLGTIHVLPGAAGAKDAPDDRPLADLPPSRGSLGGARGARAHLADAPWFWGGLSAPPFAFLLLVSGSTLRRKARERLSARKASPTRELALRLAEAEKAARGTDAGAIDAATLRYVAAAALAHTGVNVKGGTADEVIRDLEQRGVDGEASAALGRLLRSCEEARFAPEGADAEEAVERLRRAKELADRLRRAKTGAR